MQTWGHSVDPNNPLRVWYFAQISGTMTKDWDVNGQFFPATNKPIESAPEAHSIEWTADGKVRYATASFPSPQYPCVATSLLRCPY